MDRLYLSNRSQCSTIEGCMSKMLPVPMGVPQGPILGLLLYTIFTNELPEVIHEQPVCEHFEGPLYNSSEKNGCSICSYADDTALTCSDKSSEDLT